MALIKFQTGQTVRFNGDPTPQDIEEVAVKLGLQKPAQQNQQAMETSQEQKPFTYDVAQPKVDLQTKIANANKQAEQYKQEAKQASSPLGFAGNVGRGAFDYMAASEIGLGKTIAKTQGNQSGAYADQIVSLNNTNAQLYKTIKDWDKQGKDTTKLKMSYNANVKQLASLGGGLQEEMNIPTKGEAIGQIGGTALDVLTAGTYGKAKAGMSSFKLAATPQTSNALTKVLGKNVSGALSTIMPEASKVLPTKSAGLFTKQGSSNVLKGAGVGYANDVSMNLQGFNGEENKTGLNAFKPGLGAAIGGAIPTALAGEQSTRKLIGEVKNIVNGKTPKAQAVKIMQRVFRVTPTDQIKFNKMAGENIGEYVTKRGIYDKDTLAKRFLESKETADNAIATLQGRYKATPIETMLKELGDREVRVSTEGAPSTDLSKVSEMIRKYNEGGLDMSEINQAKRLYERNVKTGYLKEMNADKIARATNIDTAVRNWQMKKADYLGLKNLKEINKETQLAKQLINSLDKKEFGMEANNNISITDWIMLSGASPANVAGFATKRIFSNKGVQSSIARKFAGEPTVGAPVAKFKDFGNPKLITSGPIRAVSNEATKMTILNAKKGVPGRNPKTGRMFGTLSSEGEINPRAKQTTPLRLETKPQKLSSSSNNLLNKSTLPQKKANVKTRLPIKTTESMFGAVAGIEIDENGKVTFNKEKALAGIFAMAVAKKISPKQASINSIKYNLPLQIKYVSKEAGKYLDNIDYSKAKSGTEVTKIISDAIPPKYKTPDVMATIKNFEDFSNVLNNEIPTFKKGAVPKTAIPLKKIDPLLQEAKKYKSAEEFYQKMPIKIRDEFRNKGIKGQEQIINWFDKNITPLPEKPIGEQLAGKIKEIKLKSDTFYHGTSAENTREIMRSGFKSGKDLPEDVFRGGGYGKMQNSISFAETPKEASIFSKLTKNGEIIEVKLKPNSKVVSIDGVEDAIELENYIEYLKKEKVDAVYIGGGEKELVVINTKAVTPTKSQLTDI